MCIRGRFQGWYDEREEKYVTDSDAELAGFKDAFGTPLKRMSEDSYFFRMSKYVPAGMSFRGMCTNLVDEHVWAWDLKGGMSTAVLPFSLHFIVHLAVNSAQAL